MGAPRQFTTWARRGRYAPGITHQHPHITGIHETVLYAREVAACAAFYRDVVGLRPIGTPTALSAVLRLPEGDAVLLIFDPRQASLPGRGVPSHGAWGVVPGGAAAAQGGAPAGANGHVAFRVGAGALDQWRVHLASVGVPIEMEVPWERGGRSIYVRDPAGNSVEFVEGRVWAD
ncbi:MAG: VOC family protein [Phycisphaerales bacterium]